MDTKMYALADVKAVEDDDEFPHGGFDVVLSSPTLDRDDEIIDPKAFDPLPDHITFDIDHGMSTATTVGSGVPFYDEQDRLRVKGGYSSIPRAQEVRTLVREGHIRTTSVAFMGAQREQKDEDGKTHITKAELLNGAFVPIPSNREALVLTAKAYAAKVHGGDPVSRKVPDGMTVNELRTALERMVVEAYGDDDTYIWVRDFTDEWVVFEASSSDTYSTWQQPYGLDGGKVSLAGEPAEVTAHTTYEPVEKAAPIDSTPAPVTPDDESGKSPASTVVAGIGRDIAHAFLGPAE